MLNIFSFGKKKEETTTNTVENVEMTQQVAEPVVQQNVQTPEVDVAPAAPVAPFRLPKLNVNLGAASVPLFTTFT